MKAIGVKIPKALPTAARLSCVDNTGARVLEIIAVKKYRGVKNRYPKAGIGDIVVVSVKKGTPAMRKQIMHAVIIRQKKEFRRANGVRISFEDNAAVITDEKGMPKGTEIKGAVAREVAARFPKIGSAAAIIV
ncbi:50S ribosomal protein L14 [Methanosarcinales archaeon]|uniref:Large ribosomal subunit protein uL14 n=1 Tax=Candidatus Syntropharchaeum caldarium TaxID=1838285 RepID=A0A1F2PBQ8_9EURY|nr:MAG: 50S ribosomal protein L14 [Candidatus Syntrophoarchaeum caldarius]RLG34882.1 MAG: 50S ribosomal protein L14 [Methanosarcinales archaeon]